MTMTHALSDGANSGTHVDVRVAKPAAEDMQRFMQLAPMLQQSMQASTAALVKLLNQATAQARAEEAAEPKLPTSSGRFATQPVAR